MERNLDKMLSKLVEEIEHIEVTKTRFYYRSARRQNNVSWWLLKKRKPTEFDGLTKNKPEKRMRYRNR